MESFHPIVVHFPIALLLSALVIETLALLFKNPFLHRVSLCNLGLGFLGAAAAVFTGRLAMAVAKHSYEIHQVMELHEHLGYVVCGLAASVFTGRILLQDRLTAAQRWCAFFLLFLACGLMVFSAHLGGRLVYEYGVGGSYGRSLPGIEMVQ